MSQFIVKIEFIVGHYDGTAERKSAYGTFCPKTTMEDVYWWAKELIGKHTKDELFQITVYPDMNPLKD